MSNKPFSKEFLELDSYINEFLNKDNKPSFFHKTSELTQCPRRMCYRVLGNIENDHRNIKLKYNNNQLTNKWLDVYLYSVKKCKDTTVSDSSCNIIAHVNIIKINDDFYTFTVKSCNSQQFDSIIKNGPTKKDTVEIMADAWLAEIPNSLIIYENMENMEYKAYHVKQYKPIIETIKKKCLEISKLTVLGLLSPKPYENPETEECLSCGFSKTCWNSKETQKICKK